MGVNVSVNACLSTCVILESHYWVEQLNSNLKEIHHCLAVYPGKACGRSQSNEPNSIMLLAVLMDYVR